MLCNFIHSPVTPSFFGPSILDAIFSYTVYLGRRIPHAYKVTGMSLQSACIHTYDEKRRDANAKYRKTDPSGRAV